MHRGLRMPGNDALRVDVEDERDIHTARPGSDICEIRYPGVVRPRGGEVAVQEVAGTSAVLGGDRRSEALCAGVP